MNILHQLQAVLDEQDIHLEFSAPGCRGSLVLNPDSKGITQTSPEAIYVWTLSTVEKIPISDPDLIAKIIRHLTQ